MLVLFSAYLAAEAADVPIGVEKLLEYGPLGIIAGVLIWFARGAYQRERDRADRLEGEVRRLQDLIAERVIPVLILATSAIEANAALLQDLQREREITDRVAQRRGSTRGGS